jgi:ABC-2 type transport system permease protein
VIACLTPTPGDSLPLALPGLIALPLLTLAPGLIEDYLPLSRPAATGDQSSRNMGLMFVTMLSMAALLGFSWLAQSLGLLWVLIATELIVVGLLHWSLNRRIRRRRIGTAR